MYAAPLLEEKWDLGSQALIPNICDPFLHRSQIYPCSGCIIALYIYAGMIGTDTQGLIIALGIVQGVVMKQILLVNLALAFSLALSSCGLSQTELATQTSIAETATAALWTDTPTLTATPTSTSTETETPTPPPTLTPDPCLPENLVAAVRVIDDLQIKFDVLSGEAANLPGDQVPAKLDEIRDLLRIAAEQKAPPCLETLKGHQLDHMRYVVKTLYDFVNNADQQKIKDDINLARKGHKQYVDELTRLLGVTPTPSS